MSNVSFDSHTFCINCRGSDCNLEQRCNECKSWEDETMNIYIKHRKVLAAKSKAKKTKAKVDEVIQDQSSVRPKVVPLVPSDPAPSSSGISESRVVQLISESLSNLSSEFSQALKDSFVSIEKLVDKKIKDELPVSNTSLSGGPSSAPTHSNPSQVQRDPSLCSPRPGVRHSGDEVEESEQTESAEYPLVVQEFIEYSRSQGVNFDQKTLDTLYGRTEVPVRDLFKDVRQPPTKSVSWEGARGESRGPGSEGPGTPQPSDVGVSGSQVNPVGPHEGPSPVPKEEFSSDSFNAVMRVVFDLCPESVPSTFTSVNRSCDYEGMFSKARKPPKETLTPTLYHRVEEIVAEVREKFATAAAGGKGALSSFPQRSKIYAVADHEELSKSSNVNQSLPRLSGQVSSRRSVELNFEETARMEALANHAIESQNVSFWTFKTLLRWISSQEFQPSDPVLFEEVIRSHTLAMVKSTSLVASLASFCKAKCREAYLSHFPAHVGKHFRTELASSSFDGPDLFQEDVLNKVCVESKADSSLDAQLSLAKAATFPVFGAGRGDRKASSDSSSNAASSSTSSRGRGRGSLLSRLSKRKADPKDSNPKAPKSPRKSSKSPRGRGFQK